MLATFYLTWPLIVLVQNWTLGNVKEIKADAKLPEDLENPSKMSEFPGVHEYLVFDRAGLRIGVIGVMSE